MQPNAEIRLIHPGPGMGWEWAILAQGKTVAASDGDAHHPTPADALMECSALVMDKEGGAA